MTNGQSGAPKAVAMRLRSRIFWLAALLVVCLAAYVLWPRTAHLRDFDASRVAQLETRMWRSYYEKHYVALLVDLYGLSRDQYGFSPADSLAIAWYAARAAKAFQPTTSRAEAQKALPLLERYFAVIREHGGETFDTQEAARVELDWWQLRRENSVPADYGRVIAQVTTLLYHADNADVARAGRLRAEMMTYRDERRDDAMKEADWLHIERELERSYRALHDGIAR
ncbi:MAG TPA: hypothetical protein VLW55_19190 [Burkholderiaceae bacterium]|nr:hypothetical protein [Burkholderiaceae bacterium]